jgi:multimeric flavodoxin WrbA
MRRVGVGGEVIRAVDHQIATGVYPDMTEHGWERDEWPAIFEKVAAADILVLLSPIWLGEKSSICTQVIERLYGNSHLLNDAGQWAYYGRVAGCIMTGNEDGAKHCAMNILYSLQHLGYVIPPQADSGWLGEAGPGPSYLDSGSGGPENDFTNHNTTFLTWNLLHLARMIKDAGGIPATGTRSACGTPVAGSTPPTPSTEPDPHTPHQPHRARDTRSLARRREERSELADRVGLAGVLVRAIALDPREAQRDATGVPDRGLNPVEGDLDDQLRADEHRDPTPVGLARQELTRLPFEQLIG